MSRSPFAGKRDQHEKSDHLHSTETVIKAVCQKHPSEFLSLERICGVDIPYCNVCLGDSAGRRRKRRVKQSTQERALSAHLSETRGLRTAKYSGKLQVLIDWRFARALRAWMFERKLSPCQLSERTGITDTTIRKMMKFKKTWLMKQTLESLKEVGFSWEEKEW